MRRFRRSLVRAVVGLVAIGAWTSGSVTPALAATNPHDWSQNSTICRGCANSNTNLVRFWQAILWADNIGGGISGTGFIDGQFGPNTESKTKNWQAAHRDWNGARLVQDGRVGPRTWWSAQREDHPDPYTCTPPDQHQVQDCTYHGDVGRIFFFEITDGGRWIFFHPGDGAAYVIADPHDD